MTDQEEIDLVGDCFKTIDRLTAEKAGLQKERDELKAYKIAALKKMAEMEMLLASIKDVIERTLP